jgi:signal transduction histidine kinase
MPHEAAVAPIDAEAFARSTINILAASADERDQLRDTQRAVLNMLEGFASEKRRLEDTQRATLNILEDFERVGDKLRAANRELTNLDSLKNEFVAMASHELRTPLTSISGFSSTMLDLWPSIADEDKLRYVEVIDQQARRLTRLIEDLLTLSHIESGALKVTASAVNVASVIRQSIDELGVGDVDVTCDETTTVKVDRDHLLQIMSNFISNADKYGSKPVTIEATVDGDDVRIQVCDQGAGVPPAFIPRLFERFAQADDDLSRSADGVAGRGTGLGLSIVRALAEAHGGEAWYAPNDPVGTCFNVRLPSASRPAVCSATS